MNAVAGPRPPSQLRRNAAPDRRRHHRVRWRTKVRGLGPDGSEFNAETVDIAAGGVLLVADRTFEIGDALVLYLEEIGRVEAVVARSLKAGYAVEFRTPARKRDKIADQLTWLINRDRLNLTDERISDRRPATGQVVATFGSGVAVACSVVDVSLFGVALKTTGPRPMLGDKVVLNGRTGVCVRYTESGGFAVDFRTFTG